MTYYQLEGQQVVGIPLYRKDEIVQFALVDFEDAKKILSISNKWKINSHGYAYCRKGTEPNRALVLMHRVILDGPGGLVDHANRNRLDNRRANLRCATYQQNAANSSHSAGITGYRGVSVQKQKGKVAAYIARIGSGSDREYLGRYRSAEEAAHAYNAAAERRNGQFAVLNQL